MERAYRIIRERCRAPVVKFDNTSTLQFDYVANTNDTWVTFVRDLVSNAKFTIGLDELSRIIFNPAQETASLQAKWSFDDSNSSILYPDIDLTQDLYGIPNAVEVILSNNRDYKYAKVVNDDSNSPTSIVNRGREIIYRETNPSLNGDSSNTIPSEYQIKQYAEQLLKTLSTIECTVSYTHAYCPVRLRDCVRLNYTLAGLNNVKAKVISQSIKCETGCSVSEKAVYTAKLWR
jgi:hypothetical protein